MKDLLTEIKNYHSQDPEEFICQKRFIDFMERNEDCFERSNEFGHITASAFIVDSQKNKILLLHHKKLDKWLQPGGHCDGDRNTLEVAKKEVWEETGLEIKDADDNIFDLDIHIIPERKGIKEHFHFDVRYKFEQNSDVMPVINNESNAITWIDAADLEEYTNEISMIRMRNKFQCKI